MTVTDTAASGPGRAAVPPLPIRRNKELVVTRDGVTGADGTSVAPTVSRVDSSSMIIRLPSGPNVRDNYGKTPFPGLLLCCRQAITLPRRC